MHSLPQDQASSTEPADDPLPSLSMDSLTLSPEEVIHAFSQPFDFLIDTNRIRPHAFRGQTPYYAVDVTDEVEKAGISWSPSTGMDEVGGSSRPGRLEIWGLTGWYLNIFLQRMGLYQ